MAKLDLNKISFLDFDALYRNGFISDEEYDQAKDASGSDFNYDFWQLTLRDFNMILKGRLPDDILKLFEVEGISTAEFLKRSNAFEQFISTFCEIIEKLTIKETPEEKQASKGLPEFMNHEGMLVFVREYFGHKSFTEAEDTTLADFYLAKKDSYAKRVFERNMQAIMMGKIKK